MTRMWEVYFHHPRWSGDFKYTKVIAPNAKAAIFTAIKVSGWSLHSVEKVELVGDTDNNRP